MQRIVIGMMDGFGMDYYEQTPLPGLKSLARAGFFKRVGGVFPSVTNVNNVSIACSAWPKEHGITANSYFDEANGEARYMNAADMIRAETVFQRVARSGVRCALLTAKRKSVELFQRHVDLAVTAEDPPLEFIERYGKPAHIYRREINYWLWEVAGDLLKNRPQFGLIYVHTTDYPMHTWAPEEPESLQHLMRLDELIGAAVAAAPDAAFLLTADHGMNYKTQCWDLTRICEEAGVPIRFALSPERDYYIRHHRNFTGCSWVWLHAPGDFQRVAMIIDGLDGVDAIIGRNDAARCYHQIPERLGDMVILGDRHTMFGDLDSAHEKLGSNYRAHGSNYEMDLPLIVFNWQEKLPGPERFQKNKDLAHFVASELRPIAHESL